MKTDNIQLSIFLFYNRKKNNLTIADKTAAAAAF